MNTHNFKINNWVEIIQRKKGQYTTIQNSSLSVRNVDKTYKPIRLDSNWLEVAFKFKRYSQSIAEITGWQHQTEKSFSVLSKKNVFWVEYVDENNYCHKEDVKYIHELQNIFKDFTKKELP